ncbi:MAG: large-conductance mechanosensitive channel protein MscL [Firmicutes bacterium]|nr:large-conductance mechanosensitive channel protein MscL [Bacillota bacterium]
MLKEFKEFALKGNVMDLAIGVIIGGAFGKIVASLVNDLIMPLIGILIGGVNFMEAKWVLVEAVGEAPEVAILYGSFIQSIVDFLIIALVLFFVVKSINSMKKKEEEAPAPPPEPSKESVLLEEIRDLLQEQKQ